MFTLLRIPLVCSTRTYSVTWLVYVLISALLVYCFHSECFPFGLFYIYFPKRFIPKGLLQKQPKKLFKKRRMKNSLIGIITYRDYFISTIMFKTVRFLKTFFKIYCFVNFFKFSITLQFFQFINGVKQKGHEIKLIFAKYSVFQVINEIEILSSVFRFSIFVIPRFGRCVFFEP